MLLKNDYLVLWQSFWSLWFCCCTARVSYFAHWQYPFCTLFFFHLSGHWLCWAETSAFNIISSLCFLLIIIYFIFIMKTLLHTVYPAHGFSFLIPLILLTTLPFCSFLNLILLYLGNFCFVLQCFLNFSCILLSSPKAPPSPNVLKHLCSFLVLLNFQLSHLLVCVAGRIKIWFPSFVGASSFPGTTWSTWLLGL